MTEDFTRVSLKESIVAIMSDGRWYSSVVLRRRLGEPYRGTITGMLSQLRDGGYVRRAQHPDTPTRPHHRDGRCRYAYKWTGKPYVARFTAGGSVWGGRVWSAQFSSSMSRFLRLNPW